jgi:excisionase family DNA binding protein
MNPAKSMPLRDPLRSVQEAAQRLNVNDGYVRRLVREHRIEFFRVGKFVRFSDEQLDRFLEAGRVPSNDESGAPRLGRA